MRNKFLPDKLSGCAILRRDSEALSITNGIPISGLVAFLKQSIRIELGNGREIGLSLHCFVISDEGDILELLPDQQTKLLRSIFRSQRSKEPASSNQISRLRELEIEKSNYLRMPRDNEISSGIRHAVWPIAAIAYV